MHWKRTTDGLLVLNLEDMEVDFEASVDAFIEALERDGSRRSIALDRVQKKPIQFEVRDVQIGGAASVSATGTTFSVSYSVEPPLRDEPD